MAGAPHHHILRCLVVHSHQVEQLDAHLNGADLAVRRIEAQHGHGLHGSNEFLGLGKHGVLPPLADRDVQSNTSEHGANPEKRLTVLERTKMLSGRSTGSMTAAISGLSVSGGQRSGGADSSVHGGEFSCDALTYHFQCPLVFGSALSVPPSVSRVSLLQALVHSLPRLLNSKVNPPVLPHTSRCSRQ